MRYDPSGNMHYQSDGLKKKTKEITYDSNNRITEVTDAAGKVVGQYAYDDQGFRVRKEAAEIINGAETKVEVLYPSMYFAIEKQKTPSGEDIANTSYAVNNIYLNGLRIAASLPNGECQYYLTDQVDSVSLVTDDKAEIVNRFEYLPFGETWITEGNGKNRPKFNSQELDAETGFYFFNARYQDPEICRFVTADNIVPYEDDTQSWNRYSCVRNNPVVYKDPTGHKDLTYITDVSGEKMMIAPLAIEGRNQTNNNEQVKTIVQSQGSNQKRINPNSTIDKTQPFKSILCVGNKDQVDFKSARQNTEVFNKTHFPPRSREGEKNPIKKEVLETKDLVKDYAAQYKAFKVKHPVAATNVENVSSAAKDVTKEYAKEVWKDKGIPKDFKPETKVKIILGQMKIDTGGDY